MKLPSFKNADVPTEKIEDYLLSSKHSVGKAKAAWFAILGYSSRESDLLKRDILKFCELEATLLDKTVYGRKYGIVGTIIGPNGKSGKVMTVWIVRSDEDFPRFVTAFPYE